MVRHAGVHGPAGLRRGRQGSRRPRAADPARSRLRGRRCGRRARGPRRPGAGRRRGHRPGHVRPRAAHPDRPGQRPPRPGRAGPRPRCDRPRSAGARRLPRVPDPQRRLRRRPPAARRRCHRRRASPTPAGNVRAPRRRGHRRPPAGDLRRARGGDPLAPPPGPRPDRRWPDRDGRRTRRARRGHRDPSKAFCLGVLWHPEEDPHGAGLPLFEALVEQARAYRERATVQ